MISNIWIVLDVLVHYWFRTSCVLATELLLLRCCLINCGVFSFLTSSVPPTKIPGSIYKVKKLPTLHLVSSAPRSLRFELGIPFL